MFSIKLNADCGGVLVNNLHEQFTRTPNLVIPRLSRRASSINHLCVRVRKFESEKESKRFLNINR